MILMSPDAAPAQQAFSQPGPHFYFLIMTLTSHEEVPAQQGFVQLGPHLDFFLLMTLTSPHLVS